MDGAPRKIRQSLQFKLSMRLSVVILLTALIAGILSFVSAFREANELQDDQLKQVAELINHHHFSLSVTDAQDGVPDIDPESRVVVQVVPTRQPTRPYDAGALALPLNLPDGLQTVTINQETWRLFVRKLDTGIRVAVGQQTIVRDEVAQDSAIRTLLPLIILIPILVLLVADLIYQMFKPLKKLALNIEDRSDNDLDAVSEQNLPSEIRPFVVAINRLFARVAQSVATQRRFLADAAHEMRSPLMALSLQTDRLSASDMSEEAQVRLATLRTGLQRTKVLLDQMLTLARLQEDRTERRKSVAMQQAFRHVVEDLLPLAEAKEIDLGVVGNADATLITQALDLHIMLKNLVENAIKYTQHGGKVDLSLQIKPDQIQLIVEDNGPGIPLDELERVFDPFYRVLGNDEIGSGLGLSIVQTIASRIGATIHLDSSNGMDGRASGLRVIVSFTVPLPA
ncbi:ATP-binding protein [Aquirhabdus parva]|uniref:histidine kinase n=1 Tax=Aquirhabdus parva TaxID=2283318 RepID=A0A345PA31_9GAMM|nr:ATP-binding protein [Aquirhabdus parva]AXI04140.1 two-component sensor histidine kinase [Aquirhabdus parva]